MEPFKDITNHLRPYSRQSSCPRKRASTSKSMIRASRKGSVLPPSISAKSWAVVSAQTGELLLGRNHTEIREMASLTKIMNCYTALSLAHKWKLNLRDTTAEVSKQAARINGTRAELVRGDQLSLWDIMHGMMLPSGNDAAICIAQFFGQLVYKYTYITDYRDFIMTSYPENYFINEMNKNAKKLGLNRTNFANPHGLSNINNKSTAFDIGRLCSIAMKVPEFCELVNCKEYTCLGTTSIGDTRKYHWMNTHRLLWEGYSGIKTGITPNAGPCLASYYKKGNIGIIVILLRSKSLEARWDETKQLVKMALNRINYEKAEEI